MRPSHLVPHFANVRLHAIDLLFYDSDTVTRTLHVVVHGAPVSFGFASLIDAHRPEQAHRKQTGHTA